MKSVHDLIGGPSARPFTTRSIMRSEQAYHLAWLAQQRAASGGGDQVIISLTSDAVVISATANQAIPASQDGATYDNYGAAGDVVLTLPPWRAGLLYSFAVVASHVITVAGNGGDVIAAQGSLFGSLGSDMEYSFMSLLATNRPGVWVARTLSGGWSG